MKALKSVSRAAIAVTAIIFIAGCGLAETGAVAATQGASAAEQAKQAKEVQAKVEADIAAAQATSREAIDAAEAASQ
jgi:hypothetical protein